MSEHEQRRTPNARPIRVGFLTPTLVLGGAGRWMTSLARHLPGQSNHQITAAIIGVVNNASTARSAASEQEAMRYTSVAYGQKALEAVAAQSDVLLVWGLRSLDKLPTFQGPVVFVGHGHCQWTVNILRGCLPRVTHWAAVSHAATQSFPDPAKVTVIHNGIESQRCAPTTSRDAIRAAWGLAAEHVAVGYIGRLSPEKNPLDCARAVRALGEPYRAVYVGDGWRVSQTLRELGRIAPEAIYSPPVLQVGDVLQGLDCSLLTSPSEGFSLALAEAWYCGCPTVCTPVGALPELESAYGKLAVTVPVGAQPAELAAAVRQAIVVENFPAVDRASRVVRQHFTAEAMAKRWAEYLRSIV